MSMSADPKRFRVVDASTETRSDWYGIMGQRPRFIEPAQTNPFFSGDVPEAYTRSLFFMQEAAGEVFSKWGEMEPAILVEKLLTRNGLTPSEITFIAHQASAVLIESWANALKPGQYLDTLKRFANMTLASVPVTMSYSYDKIDRNALVILGMGLGIHVSAVLLQREEGC